MDNQTISCPRCMKSITLVINDGGDKVPNQRCWHCNEQLSRARM